MLEANRHAGEVLLGEADDSLVDVAEGGLLDTVVLDNLTEDTTVTAANYQDLLRVGVGVHGKVGDHLLVAALSSTIVRAFQLGVTYENSSRSVHWMTLSRTRTVP